MGSCQPVLAEVNKLGNNLERGRKSLGVPFRNTREYLQTTENSMTCSELMTREVHRGGGTGSSRAAPLAGPPGCHSGEGGHPRRPVSVRRPGASPSPSCPDSSAPPRCAPPTCCQLCDPNAEVSGAREKDPGLACGFGLYPFLRDISPASALLLLPGHRLLQLPVHAQPEFRMSCGHGQGLGDKPTQLAATEPLLTRSQQSAPGSSCFRTAGPRPFP